MRVLIVKLSSLGDVVHALPALQDIRRAHPGASVDWVVEPGFAPLLRRAEGIGRVIEAPLRRWSQAWAAAATRAGFGRFRSELQGERYDAVIDLQGLTKSAVIARVARLTASGHRYGLANRTDGAGWERPARWLVDTPITVPPRIHAMDRSRELAARALGHQVDGPPRYGLHATALPGKPGRPTVAFVHASSRDDKGWPTDHWLAFGRRVLDDGWAIALPQGSAIERERAEALRQGWGDAAADRVEVWPTLGLDAVLDRLAATQGVVGVDSGLSHIAVALDLPHVQLYNFPSAWRTGPQAAHGHAHQCALEGTPTPSVDAAWQAWQRVRSQVDR